MQAICQTILIISKGKLVACDTPENLERLFAGSTTVELRTEASKAEVQQIISGLSELSGSKTKELPDGGCSVRLECSGDDSDSFCRQIFFAFADAKKAILELSVAKASLEDIFIELTSAEQADKPAAVSSEIKEEVSELIENTEKEEHE